MERKHKALSILLLMVMMVLFTGTLSYAGNIPQMINYSGTLTNTGGTPVPNGNYNIEFKLYDVASGGVPLWSEKWDSTTSQVPVVGGIFNVMLGFQSPIPASFFADHPVTYLGIKVGTDSEMLPRQQITSVGYAFTAGNGVPKGGIILWSGAVDQIPAGWALCDGNNGTPNLRDRFIVGAGSTYAKDATGGSTTMNLPLHVHTGSSHTHTGPSHTHVVSGNTADFDPNTGMTDDGTDQTDASRTHNHSVNITSQPSGTGLTGPSGTGDTGSAGNASLNIMPPYYALAFIMKL